MIVSYPKAFLYFTISSHRILIIKFSCLASNGGGQEGVVSRSRCPGASAIVIPAVGEEETPGAEALAAGKSEHD